MNLMRIFISKVEAVKCMYIMLIFKNKTCTLVRKNINEIM